MWKGPIGGARRRAAWNPESVGSQTAHPEFWWNLAAHDIILIGASAGGVAALMKLAKQLPADLPASVFVVVHYPSSFRSNLPEVLCNHGPLPVGWASDGQVIQPGRMYVAPPDFHLLLDGESIHLWRGPKENRFRPAINALFRSAAVTFGPRVAGVVLTGLLDDGATGMWWVKKHGGVTVVQDPAETPFPDMIQNAMEQVEVDYVVSISKLGGLLVQLAQGFSPEPAGEVQLKWTPGSV